MYNKVYLITLRKCLDKYSSTEEIINVEHTTTKTGNDLIREIKYIARIHEDPFVKFLL